MDEEEGLYDMADRVGVSADAPAAAEQPAPLGGEDALLQMLGTYSSAQPTSYSSDIDASRKKMASDQTAFENTVRAMYEGAAPRPSRSELYFKLAQSFLTPGKTGNFTEGLAGAAGVAGEHAMETRKADQLQRQQRLASETELAKIRLGGQREDLETLRALDASERGDRRVIQGKLLERYLASGKPQSEAGKEAQDAGFRPGTPEFGKFVQERLKQKLESGLMMKQAMLSIAQGTLAVRQDAERRASVQQELLTPTEMDAVLETQDAIGAAQSAKKSLSEALKINSTVFSGTAKDRAQYAYMQQMDPKNTRVKNTELFENLMTSQAASQLKAIFGGNPTEGERKILLDLQGLTLKSPEARESVIKRAEAALDERAARLGRREKEIRSGNLRMRQPATEENIDE